MSKKIEMPPIRCGLCRCWFKIELDPAQRLLMLGEPSRGYCFALPPTAHPVYEKGQIVANVNLRPALREDESCSMFEERENDAANDTN